VVQFLKGMGGSVLNFICLVQFLKENGRGVKSLLLQLFASPKLKFFRREER